jgi:uncharacterized membrane protein YkvA (DUF1232 family)
LFERASNDYTGMKPKTANTYIVLWPARSASERETHRRVRFLNWADGFRQRGQSFQREVCVVWLILKDPRTPWYARLVAAFTVGYLFSPVQLIPSFIPVIGLLDDFAALWIGYHVIRRLAPSNVMRDCREQSARSPTFSVREMKPLARLVAFVMVAIWLMAALAATLWLIR